MLHRTILVAALLSAPLALSPASVSAQERGMDRAATASAGAAMTNSPAELPPGMEDRALPPGMLLTRGTQEGATSEGTNDDSTSEENCPATLDPMTGQLVDCHGNVISD